MEFSDLKIFLTGSGGFVGRHIVRELREVEFVGLDCTPDVLKPMQLSEALRRSEPDAVVHLAAITFVPQSIKNPRQTYEVNFVGTLNLLEALSETKFRGRLLYISSSDAYGRVAAEELPITENRVLKPWNPYAASKVAAEALCYQWSQSGDFEVITARPFNHIGPGQSSTFVISDLARQLVEISRKERGPYLEVGDLDTTRDFTDVRDVIRAYELILKRGKNGEIYNVCSERETSIREVLELLIELSGQRPEIRIDESRIRSNEQKRACGSFAKLRLMTGWRPRIPLRDSLSDILNYWHSQIS